ncbi:MAG: hypothetical protein KGS72_11655 [Cyanobacteria bacterium REEB67]|nr:hypothetical protein [Cyanobacteria bacterium REEB67]
MQGTILLIVIMVVLFGAAYLAPDAAGIFVLCGLGVGFLAVLSAMSLVGKK